MIHKIVPLVGTRTSSRIRNLVLFFGVLAPLGTSTSFASLSVAPQRFRFYVEFIAAGYRIELKGQDVVTTHFWGSQKESFRIKPTEAAWADLRKKLDAQKIWRWHKSYPNPGIVDGAQWSVDIGYADRSITAVGVNKYPTAGGKPSTRAQPTEEFFAFVRAIEELTGQRIWSRG